MDLRELMDEIGWSVEDDIHFCPICNTDRSMARYSGGRSCLGCGGVGFVWSERNDALDYPSFEPRVLYNRVLCPDCGGRLWTTRDEVDLPGCEGRPIRCGTCLGLGHLSIKSRRVNSWCRLLGPVVQTRRVPLPSRANEHAFEDWESGDLRIRRFDRYRPAKPGSAKHDPLRSVSLADIGEFVMSRISSTLEIAQVRISLYESDFRAGEPLADYERAAKLCERFVVSPEQSYLSIEIGDSPAVIAEVSTKEVLQPGTGDQEARERFTVEVLVRQGCALVSVTVLYGKGPEARYRTAEKRLDQATQIAEVAISETVDLLDVLKEARQSFSR